MIAKASQAECDFFVPPEALVQKTAKALVWVAWVCSRIFHDELLLAS